MSFQWLKRYMPRSLYGRSALILILPVVTVQLVVSIVFIKRHFEGVTEQMTHVAALELRLIVDDINASKTRLEALKISKIYPKYDDDTLPRPKTVHGFCGPQISGNVKNPKYDDRSLFGLVDGFY